MEDKLENRIMADQTKTKILSGYQRIKTELGSAPSKNKFLAHSDITVRDLMVCFGSNCYSKLVKEAGDVPI